MQGTGHKCAPADYFAGKTAAPRPLHGTLDLTRIKNTGFEPRDQFHAFDTHLRQRR